MKNSIQLFGLIAVFTAALAACGGGSGAAVQTSGDPAAVTPPAAQPVSSPAPTPVTVAPVAPAPGTFPPVTSPPVTAAPTAPVTALPAGSEPVAGNPAGNFVTPNAAQAVNTRTPTRVVGTGTADSCTGAAVVSAVALGGIIAFNCGAAPVTIRMANTAKVFNDKPDVTLDGGGLVTLDGGGTTRILYQNTCDSAQVFTSPRCDIQQTPKLTVQNLTFRNGNSIGQTTDGGGGGAIFVRGGQLKIVGSRFFNNQCDAVGPDVGGGAVRVLSVLPSNPVYVVSSTFGGAAGLGNKCANGGALSSIGVSYSVINSVFTHNEATGNGANPAQAGKPGGGSGGAIYNDGNFFSLQLGGSVFSDNTANEGGGAVFYVSNDRSGTLAINTTGFARNPSRGFETDGFPGFFIIAAPGQPVVTGSTLTAN